MPRKCDVLSVVEEPVADIRVTNAVIISPANKTVYPDGQFSFKITVHNYGTAPGDVDVKITCNGAEVDGSPVTIPNVPVGGDKDGTYTLAAPSSTGTYSICAEEI